MADSPTKRAVLELKKREGNDVCADCGKPGKFPTCRGLVLFVAYGIVRVRTSRMYMLCSCPSAPTIDCNENTRYRIHLV